MAQKKYKILMIEDEPSLAEIYGLKLRLCGFDLVIKDNGRAALEELKKNKPDLLLLDLFLPDMDGYEILTKVKKDKSNGKILVYAWSNLAQKKNIEKAKRMGVDGFLIKSDYTPSALADKVKEILKLKTK